MHERISGWGLALWLAGVLSACLGGHGSVGERGSPESEATAGEGEAEGLAAGEGAGWPEGEGTVEGEGEPEGQAPADLGSAGPDAGIDPELGTPDPVDLGPADPCLGGCSAHAHCTPAGCRCDAGFEPGGDGGCVARDPCRGVACPANARCREGACECLPGFFLRDWDCVPVPNSPLEARSQEEVCARWRSERIRVDTEWLPTPGRQDPCDPGIVPPEAQDNGLRRNNLYRWLAGLPPVTLAEGLLEQQQACATLLVGLGRLDHQPPAGSPCYTEAGARGAGRSNLSMGAGLADSVELYVGDRGVASLGHRRWVLNPSAAVTAFGYKGAFSCMYSFSMEGRSDVEVVTWPPAGFVPVDAPEGRWHVAFHGRQQPGPATRIELTSDGGEVVEVQVVRLDPGYGGWGATALGFDPPRGLWQDGRVIQVHLDGLVGGDATLTYTVRFIRCGGA